MSFSFFRGEDIFPRCQFRVPPPFLRNYRHLDEQSASSQQLNMGLDGTIQGHSLGKNTNPASFRKTEDAKASDEQGQYTKKKQVTLLVPEKSAVGCERVDMNRKQLTDLHRSIQTRLKGPASETGDLYPLAGMRCTGQRMGLAEGQQNQFTRCPGIPEEVCEQVVSNGKTAGAANCSNTVSLNKLYSCLKKMKCRRNDSGQYEDLATNSMSGREPGFNRNYFERVVANNAKYPVRRQGDKVKEEIFLPVGGKSKPVRFQMDPDGLNLLEKEWRVELKSRDSLLGNSDEEGLQLLQKFRARFRLANQRPFLGRKTPNLPIPWARHVVHKGRSQSPEEKDLLKQEDTGRKLSIHVYLPNVGWDEQNCSSPASTMFSPSR